MRRHSTVPLFYQLRLLPVQSGEVLFLQKEPVDYDILGREEQDALGRLPVPAGAAGPRGIFRPGEGGGVLVEKNQN